MDANFPIQTGEIGVTNTQYPMGDPRRYGAVVDGVTDDAPAFNNAIASLGNSGGIIQLPRGTMNLKSTVAPVGELFNLHIRGHGINASTLLGDHVLGPVLHGTRSLTAFSDFRITASLARQLASTATNNYGILLEAPDVSGKAVANCHLLRLAVYNQPSHGVLLTGNTQLTMLDQVLVQGCAGHGIALDEGGITGRVNRAAPGITTLDNCWALNCGGHALAAGSPIDTIGSGAFRTVVRNFEAVECATNAGVRYTPDQAYMRGENMSVHASAFGGGDVSGGLWVAGRDITLENIRMIDCTTSYSVGIDPVNDLTQGIHITNFRVVNRNQNVGVVIEDITKTNRINVKINSKSNMTRVMTPGVPRSIVTTDGPILTVIRKLFTQSISSEVAHQDVEDLIYHLHPNEDLNFRFSIRHVGTSGADISFKVVGPSGANIRWSVEGGIVVSSGDALSLVNEKTGSAAQVCGASTSTRHVTLVGRVNNGSNQGNLRLQFAQNASNGTNTSILEGSLMEILRSAETQS